MEGRLWPEAWCLSQTLNGLTSSRLSCSDLLQRFASTLPTVDLKAVLRVVRRRAHEKGSKGRVNARSFVIHAVSSHQEREALVLIAYYCHGTSGALGELSQEGIKMLLT